MKHLVTSLSLFSLLLVSLFAEDEANTRHVYLTHHKGLILHTTDENIHFFTKEDPKKQKDDDLLMLDLLIPSKWTKEAYLNLHVYSNVKGKKAYVGYFVLRNCGKWTGGVGGKAHDTFPFALTKKHLSESYVLFEDEKETVVLHLRYKDDVQEDAVK